MSWPVVRALDAYREGDLATRVHTRLRWATAPIGEVAGLLPREGSILEVGCGHGLLSLQMALESPTRTVHGVDIDASKVRAARAAAATADVVDRLSFEQVEAGWTAPAGRFDGVVVADVLYLLAPEELERLVSGVAAALRPGGTLVIKEMADAPRWKRRFAEAQENLSVRLLRLTAGERVRLATEAEIVGPMRNAGLEVRRHRLGRSALHPHVAFEGRSHAA